MNKCTCGVKFTGGLCSDWCDSLKPEAVGMPVYDVSGDSFIPGITNLTEENVYFAMNVVGIGNHISTVPEIIFHPALLSRVRKCGLVQKSPGGFAGLSALNVLEHPMFKQGNVFDTLIQQGDLKIILRTREA